MKWSATKNGGYVLRAIKDTAREYAESLDCYKKDNPSYDSVQVISPEGFEILADIEPAWFEQRKITILDEKPAFPLCGLDFESLCKHLDNNKPQNLQRTRPIYIAGWYETTVRDLLCKWLSGHKFPYLSERNNVWASLDGNTWSMIDYEIDNSSAIPIITYYENRGMDDG